MFALSPGLVCNAASSAGDDHPTLHKHSGKWARMRNKFSAWDRTRASRMQAKHVSVELKVPQGPGLWNLALCILGTTRIGPAKLHRGSQKYTLLRINLLLAERIKWTELHSCKVNDNSWPSLKMFCQSAPFSSDSWYVLMTQTALTTTALTSGCPKNLLPASSVGARLKGI